MIFLFLIFEREREARPPPRKRRRLKKQKALAPALSLCGISPQAPLFAERMKRSRGSARERKRDLRTEIERDKRRPAAVGSLAALRASRELLKKKRIAVLCLSLSLSLSP